MYKDRPYYTSSFLLFRPFLTFVNYFRTLNFYQVISWAFWLWAIQFVWNKKGKKRIEWNKLLLILTSISGLFLIFMAVAYSLKDEILSGYTELYSEYATIMGSAGALLFSYSLVLAYLRIFKLNYGKNTKN